MGKSYGMSEDACQEVERRLQDLKEYIRDEGGDPKTILSGLLGGASRPDMSSSEDDETAEANPSDDAEGSVEPKESGKLAAAVAIMKRKMA